MSSSATPRAARSRARSCPRTTPLNHLELVRNADLYLIAPASANTIAKLANGLADNLVTSAALACHCPAAARAGDEQPHVRAPRDASEPRAPARARRARRRAGGGQARLGRRAGRGPPARARGAAAGVRGACSARGPWEGLRVLVSAGGTREPIDAVRFVGNRSSGRMGLALAAAARARGAHVTVVSANVALPWPRGVERREVVTAAELQRGLRRGVPAVRHAPDGGRGSRLPAGEPCRGEAQEGGSRAPRARARADRRTCSARSPRAGARARRSSASPPSTAPQTISQARAKLERKGLDAVVATTSRAPTRFRGRAQRGHRPHRRGRGARSRERRNP